MPLSSETPLSAFAACLRAIAVVASIGCASPALTACSGGSSAMTQPVSSSSTLDLDTTKPPPQTVTSTPLLPPVPDAPAAPPPTGLPPDVTGAAQPPLQYDPLYSDDEQAQIQSQLTAAAARAKAD